MFWMKLRGGLVTTVCAVTCPCFWPTIVAASTMLLAGTPAAILLAKYSGVAFGVLGLIFAVTLSLALRWTNQGPGKYEAQPPNSIKGV